MTPSRPTRGFDTSALLEAIEADLRAALEDHGADLVPPLREMIEFHLGWDEEAGTSAGKRIRPLLTLLCCQAAGGEWEAALPAASAVELVHNFSLIHDDIEDDSPIRRGRPTLWSVWGVPLAINAGDALFVLARLCGYRLTKAGLSPETTLAIQRRLDRACLQLTVGQHLDLSLESNRSVTEEDYLRMIEGKTASLLAAAAEIGALAAGGDGAAAEAFCSFGLHLGLAFQIQDDVLGIWGAPETTGKPAGQDLLSRKSSLPVITGLQRSPAFRELWVSRNEPPDVTALAELLETCGARGLSEAAAEEHTEKALTSLVRANPSSPAGDLLRDLASDLLLRED